MGVAKLPYWDSFNQSKIVWPDITNRPRCSMDQNGLLFGDTAFMVPLLDYYLLAILNSWATWFYLSKTANHCGFGVTGGSTG